MKCIIKNETGIEQWIIEKVKSYFYLVKCIIYAIHKMLWFWIDIFVAPCLLVFTDWMKVYQSLTFTKESYMELCITYKTFYRIVEITLIFCIYFRQRTVRERRRRGNLFIHMIWGAGKIWGKFLHLMGNQSLMGLYGI